MSIYTEQSKAKSLWHPITDKDFNVNFGIPFVLFTEEASLIYIDSIDCMMNYVDDESCFDRNTKSLTEEGKDLFREWYLAYMYIDDNFFEAIKGATHERLDEAKENVERPELFVLFRDGGWTFLDHFDFDNNGRLLKYLSVANKLRIEPVDNNAKGDTFAYVKYFVNLNHVPETSLRLLFPEK